MDKKKVEFIESYIKIGNGDYQWNDNHGKLIRCKDCKHRYDNDQKCPFCNECGGRDYPGDNWFCADGEHK